MYLIEGSIRIYIPPGVNITHFSADHYNKCCREGKGEIINGTGNFKRQFAKSWKQREEIK